ncbi:ABC transporter ATP-binding protein [Citrobacter braakii]|uniref:ABC transporter ATP-binding protein n=1 Tax=Citrobacter braakii TaxID=57706 RepID=A0AA44LDU2_CITBR|nr:MULTISPECIES: ABC transporter ATP-binding protein [Citrobacter]MDU5155031.1 ABC transporter ATP-binding protein [Citrobacter sp.]TKV31818.1 ABC transporter ATP-binding protein [Citrobacter sp. TBCS-11]AWU66609.1 ABC transporter ATP-binding protein [Citrobacter braakii]EGT0651211.1 ABC transporter ATP-binding protein [Citrobacter braakii]MBJ9027112.1 ABC transporter ATP-binding protein [Citrobacter braakii]
MAKIVVQNVSKAYKVYRTRFSRLLEWFSPTNSIRHDKKWILKDINFVVQPGEAVGIIGINGAGKSTLLKLITGTIKPTTGTIDLTGRVAALLELGMGFHPDFTGRQNVYMSGQLLGLSNEDIDRLMPEIEEFAEIGDYIDQPVRVYSSGMQMRLAFSVATAVRPDILIIDEALSVGDSYFQHKSFDRIRQFRTEGTTLLIVSHDKLAIQSICDKAILLNAGEIEIQGHPEKVMDYYNAMLSEKSTSAKNIKQEVENGITKTISGTGEAKIDSVSLLNKEGKEAEVLGVGEKVALNISVSIHKDIKELVLGYMIKDRLGQPVYGTNTYHNNKQLKNLQVGQKFNYRFDFNLNIGEGSYSIALALHDKDTHIGNNYEWRDLALVFNVINFNQNPFVGVAWIPPEVQIDER